MIRCSFFVVRVRNLNKRHRINERFIQRIAENILDIFKKRRSVELDIVFLSDRDMMSFNKKYRCEDRPTDVLSFDLGPCGQILISSDTALRNSAIFGTSFEEEIVLYVIHGILHLVGYNDKTTAQKNRMSEKESRILKKLCVKLNFSKVSTRR